MKRRWIILCFLVVAVALGAWLIFSGKPAGRVSVRFLGYDTNEWGGRSILLWITNGHDFPVHCWFPVVTDYSGGQGFHHEYMDIAPHSALSQGFSPIKTDGVPATVWQVEVKVLSLRPRTRTEKRRSELAKWLRDRRWEWLDHLVDPVKIETVLSEPIAFPPEAKQE